jgi:carboxymethylenebutenolidase
MTLTTQLLISVGAGTVAAFSYWIWGAGNLRNLNDSGLKAVGRASTPNRRGTLKWSILVVALGLAGLYCFGDLSVLGIVPDSLLKEMPARLVSVHTETAGVPDVAHNEGHDIVVATSERAVTVRLFSAPGIARRPAVLLLHGQGGIDSLGEGFRPYIDAVIASGLDAYVVSYYDDVDRVVMNTDHETRSARFLTRLEAWAKLVDEVANFVRTRPESNGRVGIWGYSNGATLSVAAAARSPIISAVVACYGSWPGFANVQRLPPILVIHGDGDTTIPPVAGRELVATVNRISGNALLLTYPQVGHMFDMAATPVAVDARNNAVQFLGRYLK